MCVCVYARVCISRLSKERQARRLHVDPEDTAFSKRSARAVKTRSCFVVGRKTSRFGSGEKKTDVVEDAVPRGGSFVLQSGERGALRIFLSGVSV